MTQSQKVNQKQQYRKSHQIDDMNAFLKTRTEEQDRKIKQRTLMMREYERNVYPPKRHFEKTALLYSTHQKPQTMKGTWNLPNL
jgi:hypothetical protein